LHEFGSGNIYIYIKYKPTEFIVGRDEFGREMRLQTSLLQIGWSTVTILLAPEFDDKMDEVFYSFTYHCNFRRGRVKQMT